MIVWIYTNHVREIMCKIDNKTFLWKDCLLGAASYYYENSEFIKNALKHTSGQVSFLENIQRINTAFLKV